MTREGEVNNLKEAESWFLEHHSGSVLCVSVHTRDSKHVNSYPEAVKFYKEQEKE
jgi:hypothetical protein